MSAGTGRRGEEARAHVVAAVGRILGIAELRHLLREVRGRRDRVLVRLVDVDEHLHVGEVGLPEQRRVVGGPARVRRERRDEPARLGELESRLEDEPHDPVLEER